MKLKPDASVPINPAAKSPAETGDTPVLVKKHTRGHPSGSQGHPKKAKQPLSMRYIE